MQTRPRNATRHITWYLFLTSTQNTTKGLIIAWHAGSSLITSLLESRHTAFTNDPFLSACAGQIMQSRKNYKTVSRYFPLAILASWLLKNTKSRSRSQLKFPLPAPVFSSHPEYRHTISQIPYPAKPIVDPLSRIKRKFPTRIPNLLGFLKKFFRHRTPSGLQRSDEYLNNDNFPCHQWEITN